MVSSNNSRSVQELDLWRVQEQKAKNGVEEGVHKFRAACSNRGVFFEELPIRKGYGAVYKGELNGMKIAVKQHRNASSLQGDKEFKSEVDTLSRAMHENVVVMLRSCSEGNHRLLVYEFVCNGSLN